MNLRLRHVTLRSVAALALALLAGCGGSGGNNGGFQGFNFTASNFTVLYNGGVPTIAPGSSTIFNLQMFAIGGFSSPVALSSTGLPTGSSLAFNPTSVRPTAQGVPFTATFTAPPVAGDYTFTVTGTGGGITHSANLSVHVVAPVNPSFTVEVLPPSRTVTAGQPGSYSITITPHNGFTGTVTLFATGLNESLSGNFAPNTVTIIDANLQATLFTITGTGQLPGQTVNFVIHGSSGNTTATGNGTLIINNQVD
jgi:hypothetical protein